MTDGTAVDPEGVALTLLAALAAAGVPERAAHAAGYTPSRMRFYGTPVPALRAAVRPAVAAARAWPPASVHALTRLLLGSGTFEGRAAAFLVLEGLPKARRALPASALTALAEGNDNWASVDAYACGVSGPAWREGQLDDATIDTWAASPDRWLRRTALVSAAALNLRSRGGRGDVARTLAVCRRLAADRDDMVVKALSWALRELAHWDASAVRQFLETEPVAARVRREVGTKITTGTKRGRASGTA
ncbi:MAG: DNA alkylation repair protein [Myxococcota bacterium]